MQITDTYCQTCKLSVLKHEWIRDRLANPSVNCEGFTFNLRD